MIKQKVCVLTSGGLDSSVLLIKMSEVYPEVVPVYIQCGLIWEKAELFWLRKFISKAKTKAIKSLKILKVPVEDLYGLHWSLNGCHVPPSHSKDIDVYLPGRNLLLLSKGLVFCALRNIENVAVGFLKGNPFPDSHKKFISHLEKAVQIGMKKTIKIISPFSSLRKAQVIQLGRGLPLELTFSCLNPKGYKPCGHCNKCEERKKSFWGRLEQ